MMIHKARERCRDGAWTRQTPLVALFDQLETVLAQDPEKSNLGERLAGLPAYLSTGEFVARILAWRRQYGLPLYTLTAPEIE